MWLRAERLSETGVAFARAGSAPTETTIAFAGEKWGFWRVFGRRGVIGFNACCSGARSGDGGFTLVCISGRRGVIGFNLATSLRPVREICRPARPDGGASAK